MYVPGLVASYIAIVLFGEGDFELLANNSECDGEHPRQGDCDVTVAPHPTVKLKLQKSKHCKCSHNKLLPIYVCSWLGS